MSARQNANGYAKARRAELLLAGRCINGFSHRTPAPGQNRCDWCRYVYKHGIQKALTSEDAPPRPPGHQVKSRRTEPTRW